MEEYKSNSDASRNKEVEKEATKSKKVILGTAKQKPTGELGKIKEGVLSDDAKRITSYLFTDALVPFFKRTVLEILNIIFYDNPNGERTSSPGAKVSYGKYYDDRRDPPRRFETDRRSSNYVEVEFETKEDAMAVLSGLDGIIEDYRVVSIADLYDLAGISTLNHTLNRYGWADIRNARISPSRNGWVLKMPKASPID